MKKIIKKIALFSITSMLFVSCSDDDNSSVSPVPFTPSVVTFSAAANNVIVGENDLITTGSISYLLTATIDSAAEVEFYIPLTFNGTATKGSDYTVDHDAITIQKGDLSGTALVTISATGDIEVDETISIGFESTNETLTLANADFTFDATITDDYISSVLQLSMDWSGSYSYEVSGASVSIDYCDADLDLRLYDEAFGYLGYLPGSALATGACPENGSFDVSTLLDGTYYLVAHVYDNPYAGFGTGQPLPLSFSYDQDPVDNSGEFVVSGLTTDSPTNSEIGVAKLTIVNGNEITVEPF